MKIKARKKIQRLLIILLYGGTSDILNVTTHWLYQVGQRKIWMSSLAFASLLCWLPVCWRTKSWTTHKVTMWLMFCNSHCPVATQLTFHETKMVCICCTYKNKQTNKKPHEPTGYRLCLILVITVILHDNLFSHIDTSWLVTTTSHMHAMGFH